jgi:hypothetical protein
MDDRTSVDLDLQRRPQLPGGAVTVLTAGHSDRQRKVLMKKFALLIVVALVAAIAASSNNASAATAATSGVKCGGGLTAGIVHSSVTAPIPMQASWNFTAACVQHDNCYATFGKSKLVCDTAFLANMDATCKPYGPARPRTSPRYRCENVALLYHADFEDGGELQYQNAQKKAARKLFLGSYNGSGSLTTTTVFPPNPDGSQDPPDVQNTPYPTPVIVTTAEPLVVSITWEEDVETVTATATDSSAANGLTVTVTDNFTYNNGTETMTETVSGGGDNIGGTAGLSETLSGSFSGTK